MGTIVVGVDGSEEARAATRWAAEEARLRNDALIVVHVWQPLDFVFPASALSVPQIDVRGDLEQDARRVVETALLELGDARAGIDVSARVLEGSVAGSLLDAAEGAELLVVGSRGRGAVRGLLLGSVSQQCALHMPCPLVIVRRERGRDNSANHRQRRRRCRCVPELGGRAPLGAGRSTTPRNRRPRAPRLVVSRGREHWLPPDRIRGHAHRRGEDRGQRHRAADIRPLPRRCVRAGRDERCRRPRPPGGRRGSGTPGRGDERAKWLQGPPARIDQPAVRAPRALPHRDRALQELSPSGRGLSEACARAGSAPVAWFAP